MEEEAPRATPAANKQIFQREASSGSESDEGYYKDAASYFQQVEARLRMLEDGDDRRFAQLVGRIELQTQRLEKLESRLQSQEEQLAAAPVARPPQQESLSAKSCPALGEGDASLASDFRGRTAERLEKEVQDVIEKDMERRRVHEFNETVYEAAFVTGLSNIGGSGSAVVLFSIALSIAMQFAFLYLMHFTFRGNDMPTVQDVREWRARQGHLASNIDSSGSSLVSRVCGQDPALILSTDKQDLLNSLSAYRERGTGLMLTAMVLLLGVFTIGKEVEQSIGFVAGVLSRPTGLRTEILYNEGELSIGCVTRFRQGMMVIISLVRLGLVLNLLIQGTLWLAAEIQTEDMILNAAALAFLLDVDELVFQVILTEQIQVLVLDLQPLPKTQTAALRASRVKSLVMCGSLFFVIWVFVFSTLNMAVDMGAIKDALCRPPLDFAYDVHKTGVIFSAPTKPFLLDKPPEVAALIRMMDMTTQSNVNGIPVLTDSSAESQTLKDTSALDTFMKYSVQSLAESIVAAQRGFSCEDFDFKKSGNGLALQTSRRVTGITEASDCSELRTQCDGLFYVVRTNCPVTCGCDDPRSGLLRGGPEGGCPAQWCRASPTYQAALARPCQDEEPTNLQGLAGWQRYWKTWVEIYLHLSIRPPSYYYHVRDAMLQHGCGGADALAGNDLRLACQDRSLPLGIANF